MKNKKIVIAGGSGFIGRNIAAWFATNNEVVILSRQTKDAVNNAYSSRDLPTAESKNIRLVQWQTGSEDWRQEIDGCDLVINLAGKSVNCRYTAKNKSEIINSRVDTTRAIGKAIAAAVQPPKLWINAASATIYRHATDRPQDELTGEMHHDFSVQVCRLWEKTFFDQRTPFTRKVAFRMAITLGAGGVMVPYFNLIKFGLGGKQGSGQQMYSWVHITDVCRSIEFAWNNTQLEGAVNVSAPNPVTNKTFMQLLRRATGARLGLPAPAWMLKIGAAVIGTETELILKSRWVVPTLLLQNGFTFSYPKLEDAFTEIVKNLPRSRYSLL